MTETGRDVVQRLRIELQDRDKGAAVMLHPEEGEALLAVVEAAQAYREKYWNHCGHRTHKPGCTVCSLDKALEVLHSQASDEGG